MSKSGGGVGVSTSKPRVSSSIPNNVRAAIQSIKEIATNHSDDDIYAMLKECSMDPNETTQRLLFLDTFHEVKSKRDKRKENMKSRPVGESRGKPAHQWRGNRGARGTSHSQHSSYDAGERRNAAIRRENVAGETREKGFRASSVTTNGPMKVPNGGLSGGHEAQSSGVGDAVSQVSAAVGAVKREVQIQKISSESNEATPIDRGQDTTESITPSPLNIQEPHIVNESQTSLPITVVRSCSPQGVVDEATSKIEKLKFSDGQQHVIIPSHIQVPDDVKNMLSFGSFGVEEEHANSENDEESNSAAANVDDETRSKSSSREEDAVPAAVTDVKDVDEPQEAPDHLVEEGNIPREAEVAKGEEMKEDNMGGAVGPPFPVVEAAAPPPSYSFGFMPPMLVDPLVKPEMFQSQVVHVSNAQAGGSPPMTSSSSTPPPPPVQSAAGGAGHNSSVAPSPSSIALYRQSYPPNYVPYGHYYSPFYPPATMHPYYGHPAFPILAPPPNMYLPPPPSMKLSPPASYKPGPNTGNQASIGLPSGYGAFNSAHLTFNPTASSVTSANSIATEDAVPSSSLKENNSSFVAHQSEGGSTMWVGRDAASFPLGAFVNYPSLPQHLINSQTGPSAFVYPGLQPPHMGTPAPALTPLQQSQPMTGSSESVGPPHPNPNVYQQPQCQQQVNSNI